MANPHSSIPSRLAHVATLETIDIKDKYLIFTLPEKRKEARLGRVKHEIGKTQNTGIILIYMSALFSQSRILGGYL